MALAACGVGNLVAELREGIEKGCVPVNFRSLAETVADHPAA